MTDDLTAAYAEVLAEHAVSAKSPESTACACDRTWRPDREYRAHLAAALVASPATKAHEAADVRERLFVALVEQRVIDSRKYGEAPYAPITAEDVDRSLAAVRAATTEGTQP